ncbi:caspase family protein [Rhizobium leguminosarum]|uniref:caspase family protein n=1 Tax=Rhizobium leguminosarum TaxID=384 RepID=UPI003F95AF17
MRLQLDPAEPGLWTNPDWTPSMGGVFALVIGVSRYDHLDDGAGKPASKTYGLGQLSVSALTAYRFFEWLGNAYSLEGLPIAQVRLLLSPLRQGDPGIDQDELAECDQNIVSQAPEANFANCKDAIVKWYAAMHDVKAPTTGRSLFFFSGHGLEIRRGHQVLLPSNYLAPPGESRNDAISTFNILDCLPYLPNIASHVLLLDACRNDVDGLRGRGVEGAAILNSEGVGDTNSRYDQSVLYATTSGLRAYSPWKGGLSLYGQALLDGLSTRPTPLLDEAPIELRHSGKVSRIEVDKLTSYMKGRVNALIKAAGSSVVQAVRADKSSDGGPIDLTEIPVAPIPVGPESAADHISVDRLAESWLDYGSTIDAMFRDRISDTISGNIRAEKLRRPKNDWFQQRYPVVVRPGKALPDDADNGQKTDRLHELFGSEAITYPWFDTLKVNCLSSGTSLNQAGVNIFAVRHAAQTQELHRIQVHLEMSDGDPVGYLLEMTDPSGRKVGCMLAGDTTSPKYQIEVDAGESSTGGTSFLRFAGFLSANQLGPLGKAARMWDKMRALSATEAAKQMRRRGFAADVERMLEYKMDSPLAATVGAMILLKANRLDLMHDWTRNLANWFPTLSDGVVLWVEQCRRTAMNGKLDERLLEWFVEEMSTRSLPSTADCFGIAADLLLDIQRGRLRVEKKTSRKAAAIAERFDAVMPYFRETGLFCSYAAWPETLDLAANIGPKRKRPRTRKGAKVADVLAETEDMLMEAADADEEFWS